MRLSSAGDDIINDTQLVDNLEHTKKTAAEIELKVRDAKKTSSEIDTAREIYRKSASRASVLYFILNDLNKINPMYQFSLKAFSVVFDVAIQRAVMDENVEHRVRNLTDSLFLCLSIDVELLDLRWSLFLGPLGGNLIENGRK